MLRCGCLLNLLVLVYNGLGEKSMAMHEANVFPPSSLERTTTRLATPSHRFKRVLSADIARPYMTR